MDLPVLHSDRTWLGPAAAGIDVLWKVGAVQRAPYLLGEPTAASAPEFPAEAPAWQLQQVFRLTRPAGRLQRLADEVVGQRIALCVHQLPGFNEFIASGNSSCMMMR